MTVDEALARLEELGSEKTREQNRKQGAGDNQFGVRLGDIRKVAKEIKTDNELAAELWRTGNVDARMLSILIVKPRTLSPETMDEMVRSITFTRVADWFNAYLARKHPDRELLRERWIGDDDPMAARSGWDLTAVRVAKDPDGLDVGELLDRIESEMGNAPPEPQWTMNNCLAEIGINFAEYRERAITIGETLGVFRDFPTSPGCTSPFAPIWITEMVSRQPA